jgi:probable addiction module antidote protein
MVYRIEHYIARDQEKDPFMVWLGRGSWISVAPWSFGTIGSGDAAMRSRPHDEAMAAMYRDDPALAVDVINAILQDGEEGELLVVLRQLTQAFGGVKAVAKDARLNPTQLYRTLSSDGNPELGTLTAVLKAMGLRLAVQLEASVGEAEVVPPK